MNEATNRLRGYWQKEFSLLDENRHRLILAFLCAVITTIFIWLYNPMGVESYRINTFLGSLLSVKCSGIIAGFTLLLTQFIVRPLFGFDTLNRFSFFIWLIIELACLSIVMYIFYGERGRPFWNELMITTEKTIELGLLPYAVSCLLIALIYKNQGDSHASTASRTISPKYITLSDEHNKKVLTLLPKDLIYIKAEDNYVCIAYWKEGGIDKRLVRNNLKNLEKQISFSDIIRIHRSHMINISNIHSVDLQKGKLDVRMKYVDDRTFAVSSSYKKEYEERIAQLSLHSQN